MGIVNQIHHMTEILQGELASITDSISREDFDKYVKEKVPEIGARTIAHLAGKYIEARDDVEAEVEQMKYFYRSQGDKEEEMQGKTKADVLKEIWEAVSALSDK